MGKSKKSKQLQQETPAEAAGSSLFGPPSGAALFDSELDAFFKTPAVAPPASLQASSSKRKSQEEQGSKAKKAKPVEQETDDAYEEAAEDDDDEDEELQEGAGDLSELSGDEGIPSDTDEDMPEADEEELVSAAAALPAHDSDGEELPVHESLLKSTMSKKKKFEDKVKEPPHIRDKRTLFIGNVPIETIKSRSLQKKLRKHIQAFSPYPSVTRITSIRFRSVAFAVPTDDFDADTEQKKETSAKRRERTQNYKEAIAAVERKTAPDGSHEFLNPKQKRKVAFINQQLNTHADTVNAYVVIGHPEAVFKYAKKGDEGIFDSRLTAPVLAALIAGVADSRPFEDRHLRIDLVKPLEPAEVLSAGLDKATTSEGNLLIGSASGSSNDPKRTIFVGNLDFEAKEEDLREFFEKLVRTERGEPPEEMVPILGLDAKAPVQPLTQTDEEESDEGSDEEEPTASTAPSAAPSVRSAEWVNSVRIVRDKATQMGKGFAYVRFGDTTSVDEVMAVYEAEQAFLEQARVGRQKQKGKGGPPNSVIASIAIATGGKEYKRRFKFKGRPLRVSRCKVTTGQRKAPSTPPRNNKQQGSASSPSWRSKGAPTPNGTSPYMINKKAPALGTPTKTHQERATMLSKLSKDERAALKRADPDRQQRRMEKKQKKSAACRILKGEAGASKRKDKVKLTQGVNKNKTFAKGKDRPKSS